MPADDHAAEIDVLRRRYPRWTIWFGLFTGQWWALPPQDQDVGDFVEAESTLELIQRIEMIQRGAWRHEPRRYYVRSDDRLSHPFPRFEDTTPPIFGRAPAVAWPSGDAR